MMPKFKCGQKAIALNNYNPKDVVISEVEPKRWWHRQQRYLVRWRGSSPTYYDRYKENQLMANTTEGKS